MSNVVIAKYKYKQLSLFFLLYYFTFSHLNSVIFIASILLFSLSHNISTSKKCFILTQSSISELLDYFQNTFTFILEQNIMTSSTSFKTLFKRITSFSLSFSKIIKILYSSFKVMSKLVKVLLQKKN